jgi:hypothetical protein
VHRALSRKFFRRSTPHLQQHLRKGKMRDMSDMCDMCDMCTCLLQATFSTMALNSGNQQQQALVAQLERTAGKLRCRLRVEQVRLPATCSAVCDVHAVVCMLWYACGWAPCCSCVWHAVQTISCCACRAVHAVLCMPGACEAVQCMFSWACCPVNAVLSAVHVWSRGVEAVVCRLASEKG